jgi:23S rRNA pseudouridine1911/1915/1917 synthase
MYYEFDYNYDYSQQIKYFVKELGVSKALLAKIKFQGGEILVNGNTQNVRYFLKKGDRLKLIVPNEPSSPNILLDATPLDIVFEDAHFLIVNKPSGVASIPAQFHPNGTMANRVKNYFVQKNYQNQRIHVVTRLDKNTTGLMLFAKSSFAHSLLDQQLRRQQLKKQYLALVSGKLNYLAQSGEIRAPIARSENSIIKRSVNPQGKKALTKYQIFKKNDHVALVLVNLKTGRTHQIRVHFSYLGCPLLGDDLYQGDCHLGIKRQALHCAYLKFYHPFLSSYVKFKQELPLDMKKVIVRI